MGREGLDGLGVTSSADMTPLCVIRRPRRRSRCERHPQSECN
ncbi:hypothetical protein Ae168Ps1_0692c [Pseudonocardia sp. Ae168_Ps1]|nr:hypothetical protein Ae150APs1_0693c [Pseudonocardia sp. Ae150A_Ps1]OLL78286.1 hypothetical protein Ae168Ps1_0692c [Pseudonocardia sp. Ae168_Ps1]OLL87587.1 hypothetical protein Ae263Ps1_4642 [Pseudonocardia sp. Ae263_Ps1]OLL92383.1 hypothetical protein Ae356Ps1_2280c [Pseudonocardia sp. Ae356_Ps1]